MALATFGNFPSFVKFSMLSAVGGITTYYLMNARTKNRVTEKDLIVVTGCDSGLGFSVASHCHVDMKMSVIACVKDENSEGAEKLRNLFKVNPRSQIKQLDVTVQESVDELVRFVGELLKSDKTLKLYGIVNNAGVMTFGEVEWQTNEMIESQLNVNVHGTIRVSKAFLPLSRKYKSRFINVTSHCALQCLPTLSIYSATKSAIKSFTDGLRLEMNKYGVDAVSLIPGKFFASSNLIAMQTKNAETMKKSLNEEQVKFYGDYFDRVQNALSYISGVNEVKMIDSVILEKFDGALLDAPPRPIYTWEPLRYHFYHTMFKIAPQGIKDWLVVKFLDLPEYDPAKSIKSY